MSKTIQLNRNLYNTLNNTIRKNNIKLFHVGINLHVINKDSEKFQIEVINPKRFLNFLEKNWKTSYKNEDYDTHHNLVKIKKEVHNVYRKEITLKMKQKVRLEYSHGCTKYETKNMTYNIGFNPIKQYGWFEIYADNDSSYYSEGGLWFKENSLCDYDGIFSLPFEIQEQLEKWGLDTSYLD
tara:strand:- start:622 stop:1167 length:546 start_codon:yes stop_codon:yes gene_type:complete